MDYRYPISAFQAFAICLSSFDTKIACEWDKVIPSLFFFVLTLPTSWKWLISLLNMLAFIPTFIHVYILSCLIKALTLLRIDSLDFRDNRIATVGQDPTF
jgi:hypothetical protein